MIFNSYVKEEAESVNDIDILSGDADPDTEAGMEAIAAEVNNNLIASAMEAVTVLDGGEEACKAYVESAEVQALTEARKMSKKTFVRLSATDDLTRRQHLASLILARNNKDSLFTQLALNRVKEKKLRDQIYKKYKAKAMVIAKKSQKQHNKNASPLPKIKLF